ncbi:MAG: DUF1801 domain-containing protein [bacterium]|nr:DUF1801 domain-containing protein [bacterium]
MSGNHQSDASYQISEYISAMPDWSRAICVKLRNIIHKADPQMVEDWKWGPNFYHNGMVCGIGAFKKHVAFVFFQGAQLKDLKKILSQGETNVHNRRIHFKDVSEIKEKILMEYIKEAVQINMTGRAVVISKAATIEIDTPDDLQKLLDEHKLSEYFDMLAYTHRKEYVTWINEAKKDETRTNRLTKTLEMLLKKQGDKVL